jgi:hypothetical protein
MKNSMEKRTIIIIRLHKFNGNPVSKDLAGAAENAVEKGSDRGSRNGSGKGSKDRGKYSGKGE